MGRSCSGRSMSGFRNRPTEAPRTLPELAPEINNGIETIINNIEKYIPESTKPSLIHGDLWGGNILYDKGKLVGLIDPAIQYADIEFELSYLKFFNTVSNIFFDCYTL